MPVAFPHASATEILPQHFISNFTPKFCISYPRIRIYGFAYFCARLYTTHYYTEINPNSGGVLWPVSEKRIMPCRMYSVQLLSVQAELLLQLHIKTGIFDQPTLSGAKWNAVSALLGLAG